MNLPSLSQSIITAPRRSSLVHTDDLPLAVLPVKPMTYGNVLSCVTQNVIVQSYYKVNTAKDQVSSWPRCLFVFKEKSESLVLRTASFINIAAKALNKPITAALIIPVQMKPNYT